MSFKGWILISVLVAMQELKRLISLECTFGCQVGWHEMLVLSPTLELISWNNQEEKNPRACFNKNLHKQQLFAQPPMWT